MKSAIESQYRYCSLVWIFYGEKANFGINRTLEKALRTVYRSHIIAFEELLALGKSCNIQHRKHNKLQLTSSKIIYRIKSC